MEQRELVRFAEEGDGAGGSGLLDVLGAREIKERDYRGMKVVKSTAKVGEVF
jgi:hypothetical protein